MKKQGLVGLVVLTIITFGIYGIFWFARTRGEMVRKGADVPTTWLIWIPFVNLYYFYKYSMGVEKVSNQKLNGLLIFVLFLVIGIIGMIIVQNEFNAITDSDSSAAPAEGPAASPVAPAPEPTPQPTDTTPAPPPAIPPTV